MDVQQFLTLIMTVMLRLRLPLSFDTSGLCHTSTVLHSSACLSASIGLHVSDIIWLVVCKLYMYSYIVCIPLRIAQRKILRARFATSTHRPSARMPALRVVLTAMHPWYLQPLLL